MPQGRPHLPAELKRAVLVEAGHRCAIPTCRSAPVEIAHIEPWADVRKHDFENLIALCPTCHRRFDKKDIDQRSMRIYKRNLALLNSRFGDVERRVLTHFAMHPEDDEVQLPGAMEILLMYLLRDGYLVHRETFMSQASSDGLLTFDVPTIQAYQLTDAGRAFVDQWIKAGLLA